MTESGIPEGKSRTEVRDGSPAGQVTRAIESDSPPLSGILDYYDNLHDARQLAVAEGKDVPDVVRGEFHYFPGDGENDDYILLRDNAKNGIRQENLQEIVRPGGEIELEIEDEEKEELNLLAEYGVGGSRLFALGDRVRVASYPPFQDQWWEAHAHADEYRGAKGGDSVDIPVYPAEEADGDYEVEEGWTEIRIDELRVGVDDIRRNALSELGEGVDDDDEEDDEELPEDETYLEPIAEVLGQTYARYLESGIQTIDGSYDFEIEVVYHVK